LNRERFEQALRLADSGAVDQAVELARREVEACDRPDEKGGALLFETSLLLRLGRLDDVRRGLLEADRLLPRGSDGRMVLEYQRSELDYIDGRRKEALRRLERIERRYPSLLAQPDFERICKSVQIRQGMILFGLGRVNEAIAFLERSLRFESEEKGADFHNALATCYFHFGRLKEAEAEFLVALKLGLTPYWEVKTREYLGAVYFKRQAYALAKNEFEWCLAHWKDSDVPRKGLLQMLTTTCRGLNASEEAADYERQLRDG